MSGKTKIIVTALLTFSATCMLFVFIFNELGISVGGGRYGRLEAVSRIIENKYIGEFDAEEAEDAAISAVLSTIDDPFSEYYDRSEAKQLMSDITGSYVGVGIQISVLRDTDELIVLSAYRGGPAQKAGIHSGDIIVSIDGVSYTGATLDDATDYMKGKNMDDPVGTEFNITVRRNGENLDFTLTREKVSIDHIERKDLEDGIVYLMNYTGFSPESAKELSDILDSLDSDAKGIILDIRENPGGDMDAAVDICDMFLDDGMIMYTVDKDGNRDERYAKAGSCDLPMVVLVDGNSASASEILAGCMQARGRATIVGEKTYGKGVSQMVCSIGTQPDYSDGIIKFTSYKNYRPDGIWLNEGVTPDIEAACQPSLDECGNIVFDAEQDAPLKLAVEELKKQIN